MIGTCDPIMTSDLLLRAVRRRLRYRGRYGKGIGRRSGRKGTEGYGVMSLPYRYLNSVVAMRIHPG